MDILDVALFDRQPHAAPPNTPIIAQWLFTAKDGRVMKKSSTSASLAALKQALLGKTLRGAWSGSESKDSNSDMSSAAVGRPFATAHLSSGKSILVDENAWAKLIVDGVAHGGGGGDVIAMTALDPGDSPEFRRGPPQRLVGEYRLKMDDALSKSAGREAFEAPPHAITRTYMLVASSLLRGGEDVGEQPQDTQSGGLRTTAPTKGAIDGLLVSRAKAANREVETKLRRIVQWVQEVRRVRMLKMNAIFIMLPSSGTGAPGVWLERVMSVRVIESESAVSAPSADMGIDTPLENAGQLKDPTKRDGLGNVNSQGQSQIKPPPETCVPLKEIQSREGLSPEDQPADGTRNREVIHERGEKGPAEVDEVEAIDTSVHGKAACSDTTCKNVALASVQNSVESGYHEPSVSDILSDAARFALSAGAPDLKYGSEGQRGDRDAAASLIKIAASWYRRGQLSTKALEVVRTAVNDRKCAGDFCACKEGVFLSAPPQQQPPPPPKQKADDSDEENVMESDEQSRVDWTGISVSHDGNALLDMGQRRAPCSSVRLRGQRDDLRFSIANKSVCLARMEASKGLHVFWGEALHSFWKKGGPSKAGGSEESNPSAFYKEVRFTSIKVGTARTKFISVTTRCVGFFVTTDQLFTLAVSKSSTCLLR